MVAFYRHLNYDIREFTSLLRQSLSNISKYNVPFLIAGDF